MCGISGYFSSDVRKSKSVVDMARTILHRGPDSGGIAIIRAKKNDRQDFKFKPNSTSFDLSIDSINPDDFIPHNVAMAHVRYSVVDLSSDGHQPMWSSCGQYCISFNGEIYNYLEIRSELEGRGRKFKSNSDTEVILEAFIQWGEGMLARLNGFFAFSIYDGTRKKVFLARDRIGKAHLYLSVTDGAVFWASEIKALIAAKTVNKNDIDITSVCDFVIYGKRDRNGTFWNEVIDFPPGCYAWIDDECKLATHRYWTLPKSRLRVTDIGIEEAARALREVLADSLALRMRADVPIAFELSGGLDSSALVALSAGLMGRPTRTFTVKFDVPGSNEEPYARSVARLYSDKVNYNVIAPSGSDFWAGANDFVIQQEEPFHSPNLYTLQSLQRTMKSAGAHVVISGAGGDEVLAGYPLEYTGPFLRHLLGNLALKKFISSVRSSTELSTANSVKEMILGALLSDERRSRIGKNRSGEMQVLEKVLSSELIESSIRKKVISESTSFHDRVLSNMSSRFMNYWLRSGMKAAYGIPIEPRSPFLDFRVVEFGLTMPPEYLINDGWHKFLLRKAVADYLPKEVTWRVNKMGFPFPYAVWLNSNKERIVRLVNSTNCPFVRSSALVSSYNGLVNLAPVTLWRVVCLVLWWRRVIEDTEI